MSRRRFPYSFPAKKGRRKNIEKEGREVGGEGRRGGEGDGRGHSTQYTVVMESKSEEIKK